MMMPTIRRRALLAFGATLCATALVPRSRATALPADSIYQLRVGLTDQDGAALELASMRGRPLLASMFYTSCQMVCPMIFETVAGTLQALAPAQRAKVRVLMVSFDPARDTVAVLKETAHAHRCDAQWTLARPDDESGARKIAALLGVQYRRLANGEFNHSSSIALVDADGRIGARSGKLGAVDDDLLKSIRAMASSCA